VLKVSDDCKKAVDKYFDSLDQLDKMALDKAQRAEMKTKVTKGTVREAGFRDKLAEIVINSYISSIGTPAVNLLSAIVKPPLLIAERALVSMYPKNDVRLIESYGMLKGFFEGIAEGLSFAKQGWTEGMPLDTRVNTDTIAGIGKGRYLSETGGTLYEQVARPIEKYILAPVVPIPTKAGVFVDEFAKAVFRRMELNAQAYRLSRTIPEKSLNGLSRDDIYMQLRSVDISDPTKVGNSRVWKEQLSKVSFDLADELVNFAKVQTFQADLGRIGNQVLNARQVVPELVFIMPFIKTPLNIFKDALTYTPISPLWKGLRKSQGLSNEAASARLLLGAGMAYMTWQNVVSNNITGSYPKDSGRREAMIAAKIPEYSVKIGDQWYSYARVEPLASFLGVIADGSESTLDMMQLQKEDPEKTWQTWVEQMVVAATKNLTSKTFLEGISNLLAAVHEPERYGPAFINSYAGLLIPGAVAQFARGADPVQRQVDSFSDALQARMPIGIPGVIGSREELPIRYTITGEPRTNLAAGFPNIIGIASMPTKQTVLEKELQDINFSYPAPSKKVRGVELKPEDYSEYSRLSGEAVNQRLSSIINSPYYPSYSEKQRKVILERAAENARSGVSKTFFGQKYSTDPEFRNEFLRVTREKKGLE
jgi:hypothetical protein